MLVTGKYRLSL